LAALTFHRFIDIRIFKHNEGSIASQLKTGFLKQFCAFSMKVSSHSCRTSEAEMAHSFIRAEFVSNLWSTSGTGRDNIEDTWGASGTLE
jgi:hypothetical protein